MPTKPSDTPEQWATAGVYPASVYPATFPWGDPHPQAGNPTPWSGQPRRNAAGLAGFANTGNVPLQAQAGDIWNEEFYRVVELSRWTFLGTSSPDADAHIVETDGTGKAGIYGLEAGNPVQFAVSPALGTIDITNTAQVTVGGTVAAWSQQCPTTFTQPATFNGFPVALNGGADLGAGQALSGPGTTSVNVGVVTAQTRIQLNLGGSSTLDGQIYRDANGFLRYRISGTDLYVNLSSNGNGRATGVQEGSSGLAATVLVPTAGPVTPFTATTVAVTCTFQAQRNGAGTITVALQQDQGSGTWVTIGASQVDTVVSTANPNDWTTLTIARDFAADTTSRFYRLRVTGGSTHQVRSARIVAEIDS